MGLLRIARLNGAAEPPLLWKEAPALEAPPQRGLQAAGTCSEPSWIYPQVRRKRHLHPLPKLVELYGAAACCFVLCREWMAGGPMGSCPGQRQRSQPVAPSCLAAQPGWRLAGLSLFPSCG